MTRSEVEHKSRRVLAKSCFASVCFILVVAFSLTRTFNINSETRQSAPKPDVPRTDKVLHKNLKVNTFAFQASDGHIQDTGIEEVSLSQISYGRRLAWLQNESKPLLKRENFDVRGADNVECEAVHHLNSSQICVFVTETPSCQNDQGFVSYTNVLYCHFAGNLLPLGVTLLFFWWLFLFVGLAVTADDFFCPSLKVISKTLRLSDNVAGVTFLAFGNGAPDIFSSIAAIGNSKNGDAGLAFGALFGAGVFVTSAVAGTIAIICPFDAMQRPFLRDVIFYLVAVFWAFEILWDKVIQQYEAIGFIVLYVVYVIVVIVGRYVYQRHKRFVREGLSTTHTTIQEDLGNHDPYQTSVEVHSGEDELKAPITGSASFFSSQGRIKCRGDGQCEGQDDEDGRDKEREPLLGNVHVRDSPNACMEFLNAIKPIDTQGWKEKRFYGKIFEVFKCPIQFLLLLTIPVVDESADRQNWCRYLQAFQLISGPVFSCIATKVGFKVLFGVLPVWALVLALGVLLAVLILCTSTNSAQPVYQPVFGFIGFIVAVAWIYCIANEVVNILQTFGIVFDISDAVLGLTLLAWGNSVGDFIADTTMARQGYPRMGISACFGGPMFNLLLGIGIPFTIQIIEHGGSFKLQVTLEEYILAGFLALSLIISLIVVTCSRFRMSRLYGIILWILYIIFLVVAILTETGFIHAEV
ncbi:mitochondrial sodium/calcium exchanger protein-like [Liolophura sinensis]|uniref:mitochondrial sodium/calcium exchanger protein-like n=1 Tax=Liolophura sinensis TaxID=3198878 RepID=UPI0031590819